MNPYRRSFEQAVLGAVASLVTWVFVVITVFLFVPGRVRGDVIAACLLGLLVGGAIAGRQEVIEQRRPMPWMLYGSALGLVAGVIGTVLHFPIDAAILHTQPEWNRVLQWVLVVAMTGTFLGLRWLALSPIRLAYSALGGCAGGLTGGLVIGFLSGSPDVSSATAYVLAGMGLGYGYSFQLPEVCSANLLFVRSTDERTNQKLKKYQPWHVDAGTPVLIGNPNEGTQAPDPGELVIQVWDPAVAANHIRLISRHGQIVLVRHQDIRSAGVATRYLVRVGEHSVATERPLRHGDEIRIGTTYFQVEIDKEAR